MENFDSVSIGPDYSAMSSPDRYYTRTIYGNVEKFVPMDAPPPLGEDVILTSYVDANQCHDLPQVAL